jgi:hypothetical protein
MFIIKPQQFPIWLRRIAKSSGQGLDLAIQASKISTMILIQGIADKTPRRPFGSSGSLFLLSSFFSIPTFYPSTELMASLRLGSGQTDHWQLITAHFALPIQLAMRHAQRPHLLRCMV